MTKVKYSVSVSKLERAFNHGYGWEYAPNFYLDCYQCCHSGRNKHSWQTDKQFARGTFGVGANISKRAFASSRFTCELLNIVGGHIYCALPSYN